MITRSREAAKFLRVNYGINHRLQGRHFSHRSGKMRIKGDWADDATHEKIKAIIRRRHPGWNITGWCLANTPNGRSEPQRESEHGKR